MNEARVYLIVLFLVFFVATPIFVRLTSDETKRP